MEGDGEAKLENIRACITLSYAKGKNDIKNDDSTLYFRPLEDPKENMGIISLILTHALRHGMVRGSTIQEVPDNAIGAPHSDIIWLYPHRPVVAAIESNKMRTMNLEKTSHPPQLLQTIKNMGLISNLISPVTLHAIRYGNAQDVAHLPRVQNAGFTDDTVRQTLAHANKSLLSGVTERYVGSHTLEIYNDRATAQYTHPWGGSIQRKICI
jgi:hypothetical protein